MMPVFEKILVSLLELVLDPEAPLTNHGAADQQRPTTAGAHLDGMTMQGGSVSDPARLHQLAARWRDIVVRAPQNDRDEPPRMVVEVAFVVRRVPMMQADREP